MGYFSTQTNQTPHGRNINRIESTFLMLGFLAILMPTAFQSIVTGIGLIWFISTKGWRDLLRMKGRQSWSDFEPVFTTVVITVIVAAFCQLFLLFVNELGSEAWITRLRLMGKQGLYGCFVMIFYLVARQRGFALERHLKWLLYVLIVLTVYSILQRYLGVDWVHGFGQKLPDNRFAYGVYRVSAFMSHPLTFAYNCLLFFIICLSFALRTKNWPSKNHFYLWSSCAFLSFLNLFLSGSRWPLLIAILITLFALGLHFKKYLKWLVLAVGLVFVVGAFDPQIKGRVIELTNSHRSLEESMPRLVFWKVHWEMFKDYPLFGIGFDDLKSVMLEYYDALGYNSVERKYSAHNLFLQTMADSGLFGLAGLGILFWGLLKAAKKASQRDKFDGLTFVVLAVFFSGMMQNNLRDSEHAYALWMCFAVYLVTRGYLSCQPMQNSKLPNQNGC